MHLFKCEKYLIAPSNVAKVCTLPVSEHTLYNIKDVARSVLAKCDISDDNNTNNVDINLSWSTHINETCSKAKKHLLSILL